ncbi:hypothetical protein EA037_25360, partial [Salmonella enterica]|nr:hypothetical protein [Salmonella enterica]
PGAVSVTTPAQDAAGNVTATLTFYDNTGQLFSKAARSGTTTVTIGSAVKRTVDTRFYPQVHMCLKNLSANGFVVPGQTEVRLCDTQLGAFIPYDGGYNVTADHLSPAGCSGQGGGVCPSDSAAAKADFTNLTGDDIRTLLTTGVTFRVEDTYTGAVMTGGLPHERMVVIGELAKHHPARNLGQDVDVFHHGDASTYCNTTFSNQGWSSKEAANGVIDVMFNNGKVTGGKVKDGALQTLYSGPINSVITTGGDTNPEIFVDGMANAAEDTGQANEYGANTTGAVFPAVLVLVNGSRKAATWWATSRGDYDPFRITMGAALSNNTGWNLTDAYFVNNWPGTPYTLHKGNGD